MLLSVLIVRKAIPQGVVFPFLASASAIPISFNANVLLIQDQLNAILPFSVFLLILLHLESP